MVTSKGTFERFQQEQQEQQEQEQQQQPKRGIGLLSQSKTDDQAPLKIGADRVKTTPTPRGDAGTLFLLKHEKVVYCMTSKGPGAVLIMSTPKCCSLQHLGFYIATLYLALFWRHLQQFLKKVGSKKWHPSCPLGVGGWIFFLCGMPLIHPVSMVPAIMTKRWTDGQNHK